MTEFNWRDNPNEYYNNHPTARSFWNFKDINMFEDDSEKKIENLAAYFSVNKEVIKQLTHSPYRHLAAVGMTLNRYYAPLVANIFLEIIPKLHREKTAINNLSAYSFMAFLMQIYYEKIKTKEDAETYLRRIIEIEAQIK